MSLSLWQCCIVGMACHNEIALAGHYVPYLSNSLSTCYAKLVINE